MHFMPQPTRPIPRRLAAAMGAVLSHFRRLEYHFASDRVVIERLEVLVGSERDR